MPMIEAIQWLVHAFVDSDYTVSAILISQKVVDILGNMTGIQ